LSLLHSFRHARFALLLLGQGPSRLGDGVYQVALAWWIVQQSGSASSLSAVAACSVASMAILLVFGGVAVDRVPRAQILFISDVTRAMIMAGITWLAWSDRLNVWIVCVGAVLFGCADAFFQPAFVALVPQLVPDQDLRSANALASLTLQLAGIAGPAAAAALLAIGGPSLAFAVNSLSFGVAACLVAPLLKVPLPAAASREGPERRLLEDARDGLRTVMASPVLSAGILVAGFVNVALSGPYTVGMPFLVKGHLGGDEKLLGVLYAVFAMGYASAGIVMGSIRRLRRRGPVMFLCLAAAGTNLGLFGANLPLAVLIGAALINGAALEVASLVWTNMLQTLVPPEKLGRVASIDMLGSFVLLPAGYVLTGWLVDMLGAPATFIAAGIVSAGVSVLPLIHPSIRTID